MEFILTSAFAIVVCISTNVPQGMGAKTMMKIINQEGNALYPLDNLTCVRCDGCFVKVMLLMPMMRTDGAEQIPQIIVAEYENQETAQREFDKFIARCVIAGDKGVYQFPAKEGCANVAQY